MNKMVHLMLDENVPVICDPFCGSDCLSLSVPCNLCCLLCASRFLGVLCILVRIGRVQ